MKTYLICLLLGAGLLCGAAQAEDPVYRFVGDDLFIPFSFEADGEIRGIDCDIIREMARRMGIRIEITLVPWKRLIEMTRAGLCDGAFSLFQTPERQEFALFADAQPIHESTFYFFVRKGEEFPFVHISDLSGKIIGLNRGFTISEVFDQAARERKFIVEEVEGIEPNIRKLMAGRIDTFVANYDVLRYNPLGRRLLGNEILFLPRPALEKRGAYLVLSRKGSIKEKAGFIQRIDKTLKSMQEDGSYAKIYEKYLR